MSKKLEQKQRRRLAEQTRRAQEQRAARRQNLMTLGIAVAVAAAVVVLIVRDRTAEDTPTTVPTAIPTSLPGLQTGPPPWEPEFASLRQRLDALGLAALSAEGQVQHVHQHLDVFVNGEEVVVPQAIGIDPAGTFISPVHTHDSEGIIHVESPTTESVTLGQFFGVWGVRFSKDCIGGLCNEGESTLEVFVNGDRVDDPVRLALESHQQISVVYGTPAEAPNPIPSSYEFAPGE